jgi:hypothetical protein
MLPNMSVNTVEIMLLPLDFIIFHYTLKADGISNFTKQ